MDLCKEGINNLIYAIIERARDDYYENRWKILLWYPKNKRSFENLHTAERLFSDAKTFILSDWFYQLTGLEGNIVLESYNKDFLYWSVENSICERWV